MIVAVFKGDKPPHHLVGGIWLVFFHLEQQEILLIRLIIEGDFAEDAVSQRNWGGEGITLTDNIGTPVPSKVRVKLMSITWRG